MNTLTTTAPTPIPATTPFVVPPQCQTRRQWTRLRNDDGTDVEAVYLDDTKASYSSCSPPNLVRSPAVCPEGWHAHAMTALERVTKAFCCAPGEDVWPYGDPLNSINQPICICTLDAQDGTTYTAVQAGKDVPFTAGPMIQPAWVIAWDKTDRATLTPAPPDLPVQGYLARWVPGGPEPTIECDSTCRDPTQGGRSFHQQFMVAIVAPPVVIICVIVGCALCCVYENKQKARRRAMRERQTQANLQS